jgi:hypothetical protein
MVKFGNVKCETCGQEVNKKKIKLHKCVKKDCDRLEKCSVCGKEVSLRHYSTHYKSCRAKDFWKQHEKFFTYLARVVRAFNKELKRERYLGTKDERKKLVVDQTGIKKEEVDLRKNQDLFKEVVNVEENTVLKVANETAEEHGFKLDNIDNSEAIKDVISFSIPKLSCRQIIFDFMEKNNIVDKNVHNLIDKKFINKDYPTDEELAENKEIFDEIKKARVKCGYNTYYEKFYYILVKYYRNRDTSKCFFCGKFIMNLKKHLRKCIPYRNHFYKNEEEAIKFYLYTFHNAKLWENYKLYDYVDYYKQYSFNYFIETIEKRLKNRRAFMERIAEGKRRFAEINACKNKKEFVRNLIAEVDAMPPWTWSDEENEKDNEVKEEAIEENKMEEKVKEKDPFEKALEEVEKDEENGIAMEEVEKEEKLDEEKTKNTWALVLGGKFKAKLEEKKNIDISSSDEEEDDAKDREEVDLLKELNEANILK